MVHTSINPTRSRPSCENRPGCRRDSGRYRRRNRSVGEASRVSETPSVLRLGHRAILRARHMGIDRPRNPGHRDLEVLGGACSGGGPACGRSLGTGGLAETLKVLPRLLINLASPKGVWPVTFACTWSAPRERSRLILSACPCEVKTTTKSGVVPKVLVWSTDALWLSSAVAAAIACSWIPRWSGVSP